MSLAWLRYCAFTLFIFAFIGPLPAVHPGVTQHHQNRVIVKFKKNLSAKTINSLSNQLNPAAVKSLSMIDAQLWNTNQPAEEVIDFLNSKNSVEYAEPDYIISLDNIYPNDPSFRDLWALENRGQHSGTADADIDAPKAWGITTGDHEIIVGIIDTGIDYHHPDLKDNIWHNPAEIMDGKDNDNNGYTDDVWGWDFVNNDNMPLDDRGHGTHCAGIIGAAANNHIGIVGLNWNAKLMALKIFDQNGHATISKAIEALEYAINNGARISNNSWGSYYYSNALRDAINEAKEANHLVVAAAGNQSNNNDGATPSYPCSYTLDNILSVASTDHNDKLSSFSNYGALSVDLAAPGDLILSTMPDNRYNFQSGTSMAAPFVSATASLLLSLDPSLNHMWLKHYILNNVDVLPTLKDKTVSGGRLDVFKTLQSLHKNPFSTMPSSLNFGEIVVGDSKTLQISLFNSSSAAATIVLSSSHPDFVPETEFLNVSPDSYSTVDIVFTPRTETPFNESIHCVFNNSQVVELQVRGSGYDSPFTLLNTNFTPLFSGSVSWGDYDNDRDLDLIISGSKSNMQFRTQLYENKGKDQFQPLPYSFEGIIAGRVEWKDFNNDNDIDILLSGMNKESQHIVSLYLNQNNTFYDKPLSFESYYNGCASAVDFDNDGDTDIFLSGETSSSECLSLMYCNNGNAEFTAIDLDLDAVFQSVAWKDYNNDGYADLLACGENHHTIGKTRLYRNNGHGRLHAVSLSLPDLTSGHVEWGDLNNDGLEDILISGETKNRLITQLYENRGSDRFTRVFAGLKGMASGVSRCGDYDLDGDTDILMTGYNSDYQQKTLIYRNDGNHIFVKINARLQDMVNGAAAWGDYDRDGDLDIAMSGYNGSQLYSMVYKNQIGEKKEPLTPPRIIGHDRADSDDSVILRWNQPLNEKMSTSGWTFNLKVGSTPGATDVVSPLADKNGNRKLCGPGNVGHNQTWHLKGLSAGTTYYWSVQAVDQAYNTSEFSRQAGFTFNPGRQTVEYRFPQSGWYLISVAVKANSMRVIDLFPNAQPYAYYYDAVLNAYFHTDTLAVHQGYWIQIQKPGAVSVTGEPVTRYTTRLKKGWNLLGAVFKQTDLRSIETTPAASVSIPVNLWDNKIGSFTLGYHLQANQGCWVFAKTDCKATISATPVQPDLAKSSRLCTEFIPPLPPGFNLNEQKAVSCNTSLVVQNYPNPFNPETTIRFTLPKTENVKIDIYNLRGEKIQTLVDVCMSAGVHEIMWNGKTKHGQPAPSGVYLIKISTMTQKRVKKAILAK